MLIGQSQKTMINKKLVSRDGPKVRFSHSAEAEGLDRLTERVPNVRPNLGRMLCSTETTSFIAECTERPGNVVSKHVSIHASSETQTA